ncbi:Retinal guanylyl cyclase 2 [Taenia crassiceps]|uniref:Guanylate cyclase n=1 Tax=Taenia crassiceps TaxID=6207 RepID=A0ABR4QDG8_9CEST
MPFHLPKSASKKASSSTPSASIVTTSHHSNCPAGSREMAMKQLLLEFDSNKDGVLTLVELRRMSRDLCIPYEEFLKWTRTPWGEELTALPLDTVLECIKVFVTRQMKTKGARDLFKLADVDQSGKLSLTEIKRLLEASDYDIDDEELCAIFRRVDANRDGELDDKEFLDLVRYLIENNLLLILLPRPTLSPTTDPSNPGPKLQIIYFESADNCVAYSSIFSYNESVNGVLQYVTSLQPSLLSPSEVRVITQFVGGCNVREDRRGYELFELLAGLIELADKSQCFTVFVGPPLAGDCTFISGWMTQSSSSIPWLLRPYQINYLCPATDPARRHVENFYTKVEEEARYATITMTLEVQSVTDIFASVLRFQGWRRVLLLYEISTDMMPLFWMADRLQMAFDAKGRVGAAARIVEMKGIHVDSNYTMLMMQWVEEIDAVIILARPPMVIVFLDQIQYLPRIQAGRVAILHLDPSNAITYDVLRFWRLELSRRSQLGAAGQSFFIITALPLGRGYDAQSPMLQSINTQNVYNKSFKIATAQFYELFNLVCVMPAPGSIVYEIQAKKWPHDGKGPDVDICLQSDCLEGTVVNRIVLLLLMAGTACMITAVVSLFFKRHYRSVKLRMGSNKLVLYPDDVTFLGPSQNISRSSHTELSIGQIFPSNALSIHNTEGSAASETDGGEEAFTTSDIGPSQPFKKIAIFNGIWLHIKQLGLPSISLKAKMVEHLRTLRELRHENVNLFIGCYVDADSFSFVYEECSRGSLRSVLSSESINLDWEFKLSLVTDLIQGMAHLHKSDLAIHGCLTSETCVIDNRWVLKVTDYGLQKVYSMYNHIPTRTLVERLYLAPEMLRDPIAAEIGSQEADVYAASVVMHETFTCAPPFGVDPNDNEAVEITLQRLLSHDDSTPIYRPSFKDADIPAAYMKMVQLSWSENPKLRPTFRELEAQLNELSKGSKSNIVDHMLKIMEKYSANLESQVNQRTAELQVEKQKTEMLIAKMLPPSVAQALLSGAPVDPEAFSEVTISFSDIVGFTTISAKSSPLQIVNLLNDLYTTFDDMIQTFDVYKVETIGDAYMVVSGLPIRNGRKHAGEIATMALELISISGSFRIPHMPGVPLYLRLGINSGPCVAGVIGLTMPRYCLFGDTVNTASRMESTSTAFRIHVSSPAKAILDELGGYHLEHRGRVFLRGKGEVDSYWLVGKDGFSKDLPKPPDGDALAHLDEMIMKVPQKTEIEPPTCQNSSLLLENLGGSKSGDMTQLKRRRRHDHHKQHHQKRQSATSEAIAKI